MHASILFYIMLFSYSFIYLGANAVPLELPGEWLMEKMGNHSLTIEPGRRQAIIWTSAGILLIRPLWTNFSDIFIEIHTFSYVKMHLKLSSAKWQPFCLGLNVLSDN